MTIPFCKDCAKLSIGTLDLQYPRCERNKTLMLDPVRGEDTYKPLLCEEERSKGWPSCGKKGRYFVARDSVERLECSGVGK